MDDNQTTDEEILATQNMPTAHATKRIGFKTKAAYLRRLAAAKANAAKPKAPETGKEDK